MKQNKKFYNTFLLKYAKRKENIQKIMEKLQKIVPFNRINSILVKVMLHGYREIYANTNVESVEILVSYLRKFSNIKKIAVGEGSRGIYYDRETYEMFKRFKYKNLESQGVELVDLDSLPHENSFEVEMTSGFKEKVRFTKPDYDLILSLVPPKTHDFIIVSLGMFNMIGFIHPEDKAKIFGTDLNTLKDKSIYQEQNFLKVIKVVHKNIVTMNKNIHSNVSIIDGLYGMEGKGPLKGSPVFHGFCVGSTDFVLADALSAVSMGLKPQEIGYLYYAEKEGLGSLNTKNYFGERIEYVRFPYRMHQLFELQKRWKDER